MHLEGDMAVVFIFWHGKGGVVHAADSQSINIDYIYEYFNNRNCPNLQGKTKFFIVHGCRGNIPDPGVEDCGDSPAPSSYISIPGALSPDIQSAKYVKK